MFQSRLLKKHNFYAGPSILPAYTIENTAKGILDLDGIGLSVMEISHRSKEFSGIIEARQRSQIQGRCTPKSSLPSVGGDDGFLVPWFVFPVPSA